MTVHADYLRCLLTADDLKARFGITRIPHGAAANVYARLLSGLSSGMGPENPRLQLHDDLDAVLTLVDMPPQDQECEAIEEPGPGDVEAADQILFDFFGLDWSIRLFASSKSISRSSWGLSG